MKESQNINQIYMIKDQITGSIAEPTTENKHDPALFSQLTFGNKQAEILAAEEGGAAGKSPLPSRYQNKDQDDGATYISPNSIRHEQFESNQIQNQVDQIKCNSGSPPPPNYSHHRERDMNSKLSESAPSADLNSGSPNFSFNNEKFHQMASSQSPTQMKIQNNLSGTVIKCLQPVTNQPGGHGSAAASLIDNRINRYKTRYNGKKVVVPEQSQSSRSKRLQSKDDLINKRGAPKSNHRYQDCIHSNSRLKEAKKGLGHESDQSSGQKCQKSLKNLQGNQQIEPAQKMRKQGSKLFEECQKTYQKMFLFDWDLKDIVSSRHSPKEDLTTGAFWFYINSTFFPYDLQRRVTSQSFEEWYGPIERKLHTPDFQEINSSLPTDSKQFVNLKLNQINNKTSQNRIHEIDGNSDQSNQSQNDEQILQTALFKNSQDSTTNPSKLSIISQRNVHVLPTVQKLIGKRKMFNRFKQHVMNLKGRVASYRFENEEMRQIQSLAQEIPRKPTVAPFLDQQPPTRPITTKEGENRPSVEDEVAEIRQTIYLQDFQKLICLAEKDLHDTQVSNYDTLKAMYQSVQTKFEEALNVAENSENYRDQTLYKPEEIRKYGQEFMAYVEPCFVQDMVRNRSWYAENMNDFLLNINYPCKLQNDFLKELELSQQRRNDQKYRKILDQMDSAEQTMNEQKRKEFENGLLQLSLKQRAQIAQEDACCAICGIGDYEDDDQIVFCVQCSIPVHQSCFGLEDIPENDWICYNCLTFGFHRGIMLKCFLCPKRGGAMKPTNIFSSNDKFIEYKIKTLSTKTGRNNNQKLNNMAKQNQVCFSEEAIDGVRAFKEQNLARLENNASLRELLQREVSYKEKIFDEYLKEKEELEASGTPGRLSAFNKVLQQQEEFEFHFNKHEKQNHNTPEDYSRFIQRNESRLESSDAPVTDSLYHWVHHSCSMWMAGPVVTPRTPVKMQRLDFKNFALGCVICGKKGVRNGAVVKCYKSECQIYFHVECAKRANYCMEIERKKGQREKIYKIYCESHRPFKIIIEINEQNAKEVEDIQKFTKTIEKCYEMQLKHNQKPKKLISKAERNRLLRQALQARKQELALMKKESKLQMKPKRERKEKPAKVKRWREKDKKMLLDRVKEKYLMIKKIRLNLIRMDPMIQETKRYNKEIKRIKKQEEKRRKAESQIRLRQQNQKVLLEREAKSNERGLRNRIKNGNFSGGQDDNNYNLRFANQNSETIEKGTNSYDTSQNAPKLDNKENLDQSNSVNNNFVKNDELKLDIDQQNSLNDENIDGNVASSEFLESGLGNLENYGNEVNMSNITNNNIVILNLAPENDLEQVSNNFPQPELQHIPEFYKFASPMNIQELEWTVTLSRYDFPWNEICFEPFSSKECYKMYTQMVTDTQSFLKKVLGQKQKYQKMMQNQLNGLPTIDTILNINYQNKNIAKGAIASVCQNQEQVGFEHTYNQLAQQATGLINQQITLPQQLSNLSNPAFQGANGVLLQSSVALNQPIMNQNMGLSQIANHQFQAGPHGSLSEANRQIDANNNLGVGLYCYCKGRIDSQFMVACETGESDCPNGGWVHHQCTKDLCNLTREEIDQIEVWYCEDCQKAIDSVSHQPETEIDNYNNNDKLAINTNIEIDK